MVLFGIGCVSKNMPQKISFNTPDGVKIAGNWFPANGNAPAILLLHMRPATKESWNDFAAKLNTADFSALAIDLRGHGESVEQNGKKINYENFPGGSHAECRQDVDAALAWLKSRGVKKIYIAGGSIGANLTIDAMAKHKEIKKGIALSPGLEYLGVETGDVIQKLRSDQLIYLIASKDDPYSFDSVHQLNDLNKESTVVKTYGDAGHANHMFEKYPELGDELINWLK